MFAQFTLLDIARYLALAARWTIVLTAASLALGSFITALLLLFRFSFGRPADMLCSAFTNLFEGTPLLMQLFLVFFALPLLGFEVPPGVAAVTCLTLYATAFLLDIWTGSIRAVPRGQWEAARVLGLTYGQTMARVVGPQALRIATAPTVGFLVQLIKGTALTSIIGFSEITRVASVITNATFEPFTVYGLAAVAYFLICFPLSLAARRLEGRMKCRS